VKFQNGREDSLEDEHGGRPSTNWTVKIIEKIRDLFKQDCCMSVRFIEDITNVNKLVYQILTENLILSNIERKATSRFCIAMLTSASSCVNFSLQIRPSF